jgi:hypothetical protein
LWVAVIAPKGDASTAAVAVLMSAHGSPRRRAKWAVEFRTVVGGSRHCGGMHVAMAVEPVAVSSAGGYRHPAYEMDDGELLERFRAHADRQAAGLLFDRHAPMVRRLLARTLGPFRETEDHVQEAFFHRIRISAPGYASEESSHRFDAWNTSLSFVLPEIEVKVSLGEGAPPDAPAVVGASRYRFRDCWREGLAEEPSMRGGATLALDIDEEGQVLSSNVTERTGLSTKVVSCLLGASTDMLFARGKATTLHITVAFKDE